MTVNTSSYDDSFAKRYYSCLGLLGPYQAKSRDNQNVFVYGASVSPESLWFKAKDINCGNIYVSFDDVQRTMLGRFFAILQNTKMCAGNSIIL